MCEPRAVCDKWGVGQEFEPGRLLAVQGDLAHTTLTELQPHPAVPVAHHHVNKEF